MIIHIWILANLVSLLSCQEVCETLKGQNCILPFIYENQTFNGCITLNDPENKPWCSVKVYPGTRFHISNGGHWDHCSPNCPLDQSVERKRTPTISNFDEKCLTIQGESGICKPASTCAFSSLEDEQSSDSVCTSVSSHICCKELLENDASAFQNLANKAPDQVTFQEPDQESKDKVEQALTSIRALPVLEAVEAESDEDQEITPESFHLAFNKPRSDVLEVDRVAEQLEHLGEEVENNQIGLRSSFNIQSSSAINDACTWTPAPICDKNSTYRTIDGSCNNLKEPNYGRQATPFQRILKADYQELTDGKVSLYLPRQSKNGFVLPSPRILSTKMTKSDVNDDRLDGLRTVFIMQMGQFIDHDITHAPNHGQFCCNPDGSYPERFDSKRCMPIEIPVDDEFWQGRKTCMSFARSLTAPDLNCGLEERQQMNQITHWLDLSAVYGSTNHEVETLRKKQGGQLKDSGKTSIKKGSLPTCKKKQTRSSVLEMCESGPCSESCFMAGDVRANEHHNLLAMHTVWLREHNRVAQNLAQNHPFWNDERLFQEARRIVTAEYQHIIYNEWLPLVIGNQFMTTYGMWPLSQGYSDRYLESLDPRITNEFAAAAFRFGHSTIPTSFMKKSKQGSEVPKRLRDIAFKPKAMLSDPVLLDDMVRGLASQTGEAWDNIFTDEIKNHLFDNTGDGGLDLVSLNIQRGRDHGLPGYNAYREICSIGKARNFEDLEDYIGKNDVERLKNLYDDVDDIDLFVGGILERKHQDSILGPVFKCIIADTFVRLKLGDRFFYDLGLDSKTRLTSQQLNEVRKASMARIVCDNTDTVPEIQPQAFKIVGSSPVNKVVSCNDFNSIPKVNLEVF